MKVALYLRKSTDEQADSLETQRKNAEAWCAAKGWTDVVVFEDSGISRTEFAPERRKGWFAMLAAAKRRDVGAVVVRDTSRIGGNIGRALVFVEDLLATGVRLFCYSDGHEVTGSNAIECVTLALRFYSAQGEVEAIRSRTREALFTKAKEGRVTGGAVFGYRNQPSAETVKNKRGETRPAYVERVIDPGQATTVRFVFERYAAGDGLGTIAKALNLRGIPAPRKARNGDLIGWAASSIHSILEHEIYRGRIVYGVHRKTYVGGSKTRVRTPESEWTIIDAPHLRIVEEALWVTVEARRAHQRQEPPKRGGHGQGSPPRNLLTRILRCGVCGSTMVVVNRKTSHENGSAYICSAYDQKRGVPALGGQLCTNTYRRPVDEVNRTVTTWIEEQMLREDIIGETLEEVRRRVQDRVKVRRADGDALRARADKLQREIDRFAEMALEAPPEARTVFYAKVSERKRELDATSIELAGVDATPTAVDLEIRRMMKRASTRVAQLREVLSGSNIEAARKLLGELFPEGIRADPVEIPRPASVKGGLATRKRFALSADAEGDWPLLVVGLGADEAPVPKPRFGASPAGFEPA